MFCAATAFVALACSRMPCCMRRSAFFSATSRSRRRRSSSTTRWCRYAFQPSEYMSIWPSWASRCHTLFTTSSSSSLEWEITRNPPSYFFRNSRNHSMESASRWFVGSSRMSVSASEKRMRASSMRRRCPPESVPSCWPMTSWGRPRLAAIAVASDCAAYPPAFSKSCIALSYRFIAFVITSGSGLVISFSALRIRLMIEAMSRALIIRSSAVCSGSAAWVSCGR